MWWEHTLKGDYIWRTGKRSPALKLYPQRGLPNYQTMFQHDCTNILSL